MCVDCKDDYKRKKMFLCYDVVKMIRKMEIDGYGYCNVYFESKYELNC